MKTIDESLRVPVIIGVFDRNRAIAASLLEKATRRPSSPAATAVSLPPLPLPIFAGRLPPMPDGRNAAPVHLGTPERRQGSACPGRILRVRRHLQPWLRAGFRRLRMIRPRMQLYA